MGEDRPSKAGIYEGTCDKGHTFLLAGVKGELFPPCPVPLTWRKDGPICGAPATYEFVRDEPMPPTDDP